jgi:4-amino-4-deoxy-L-arabinose transferase-like glycosyltransferase
VRLGRLLTFGVLLCALLVRLLGIATRPLWYDEAFAVLFAEKGPRLMLAGTLSPASGIAADVHPLAYYTTLWGWMKAFGDSPVPIRMLSILFGLASVAVAYWLAKELFDRRCALILAFLLAFSPFQIHYSQEVRMYAMLTFFLVMATSALWKGLETGKLVWWFIFAVCAALAQYCHNLAAFYLVPLALSPILFRRWRALPAVILAGLGAMVLYLPWLIVAPAQFAKVQSSYWTSRPGPGRLVTTLLSFVTNLPLPDGSLLWGLFVSLFILALAAWQTVKATRLHEPQASRGLWLAYLAFVPPLALFAFSQWQPVYVERALLPAGVMFLLWVGWSLTRTKLPGSVATLAFLILATGMILGIYQHITYRGFPYAPYKELEAYLAANVRDEGVIVHSNKLTMLPAVYYRRDLPQRFLADPPGSGSDTLAPTTQEALGLQAYSSLEAAAGNAQTVWFVIFERAIDEYQAQGEANHPDLAWLDFHYDLHRVEEWGDVLLYVYGR